jgi:phosphatidylethanolamine-binding protein (PEBP) family uncharacterized protein
MEQEQRNNLINEIKQIERELYLKRSQLASSEKVDGEAGIYRGATPPNGSRYSHAVSKKSVDCPQEGTASKMSHRSAIDEARR